jgi:hypothetical protein
MVLEVPRVSSELGKHRFQLLCPSGLELPTGLSKTWLFVAYIAWTVVLRASLEMRSHTDLSYCLFIVLCRDLSQKACVCCMAKVSSTNTVRYLTPYTWGCLKLSVLRDSRDIKQMDTRWKTIYCVNPKWHTWCVLPLGILVRVSRPTLCCLPHGFPKKAMAYSTKQ